MRLPACTRDVHDGEANSTKDLFAVLAVAYRISPLALLAQKIRRNPFWYLFWDALGVRCRNRPRYVEKQQ